FRAMVQSDPTNALARYGLANELVKVENYEEAVGALHEYLSMHEDEGAAYRLLAYANEKLKKYEDARQAYKKGIEAANKHRHPGMAAEYETKLEDLEDL
ncbi:MAG TPA: tetratricopeptide repeat protein, partial [Blastocatellia bacterium]|nr:tetratricopeptide repeat protein [Blastocatellia bacterium]